MSRAARLCAASIAALLAGLTGGARTSADAAQIVCDGVFAQGGFAICAVVGGQGRYALSASAGKATQDPETGAAFIAFERDQALSITVTARGPGAPAPLTFRLSDRDDWDVSRLTLPPAKVTPRTPEEQAQVAADAAIKERAFASRAPGAGWLSGFTPPITDPHRISGTFGSQRILNGQAGRVHNGLDYAAVRTELWESFIGTDVKAPAPGVVTLADPDMYFEGGFVVIDHGAGVQSLMMHLSRLDVAVGDRVEAGQLIGGVGMSGRATGPHLHWGVRVGGGYIDPAVLLSFNPASSEALALVRAARAQGAG